MSQPHTVSKPAPYIELKLTLQEAQAVLRVIGTASDTGAIEREHLRPIDWAMERLSRLVRAHIEEKGRK